MREQAALKLKDVAEILLTKPRPHPTYCQLCQGVV
jgi:hypothetical protein